MSTVPPTASGSIPPPNHLFARCPALSDTGSWTALLADTAGGLAGLGRRRVRVRHSFHPVASHSTAGHSTAGHSAPAPEGLRLVVQSYRERDVSAGRPLAYARPLASAQRAVSQDQLRFGVQLDLVHFEDHDEDDDDVVVIAWAEEGEPDLDFDGLEARPPRSARWASVEPLYS
jgi:hypothetical protein